MQYQVPQFIETEDKIVGPFTLRQFGYFVGAGAISFFLYFSLQTKLWVFVTVLLAGAAGALAFLKVNGRPLTATILSFISFYWQPRLYTWKSERLALPKTEGALQDFFGQGFDLGGLIA